MKQNEAEILVNLSFACVNKNIEIECLRYNDLFWKRMKLFKNGCV